MQLFLYEPKIEDLWFRQEILQDEETMSYNSAWGGTISFPREDWAEWFDHWIIHHEGKRFYRYLQNEKKEFVGEIAYHFDAEYGGYMANVIILARNRKKGYGTLGLQLLCAEAKKRGIAEIYDDIAIDNPGISLFLKAGFVEQYRTDQIILLKKRL